MAAIECHCEIDIFICIYKYIKTLPTCNIEIARGEGGGVNNDDFCWFSFSSFSWLVTMN